MGKPTFFPVLAHRLKFLGFKRTNYIKQRAKMPGRAWYEWKGHDRTLTVILWDTGTHFAHRVINTICSPPVSFSTLEEMDEAITRLKRGGPLTN